MISSHVVHVVLFAWFGVARRLHLTDVRLQSEAQELKSQSAAEVEAHVAIKPSKLWPSSFAAFHLTHGFQPSGPRSGKQRMPSRTGRIDASSGNSDHPRAIKAVDEGSVDKLKQEFRLIGVDVSKQEAQLQAARGRGSGAIHRVVFQSKNWLIPERRIRVWTPPSYFEDHGRRYPVVYAHDGEWVMSDGPKSWNLRPTLLELISEGSIEEPIVVMIDSVPRDQPGNLGPDILPLVRRRWVEYNLDLPGPGQAYLSFLCDELKPEIDKRFRTRSAPEDTHAWGASMGGLAAFLSLWRRPDTFGNAACFSPVFQAPLILDVLVNGAGQFSKLRRLPRVYIDIGGDMGFQRVDALKGLSEGGYWWLDTQLQQGVEAMLNALQLHSGSIDLSVHKEPGGRHTEQAFGARASLPLRHLLRRAHS